MSDSEKTPDTVADLSTRIAKGAVSETSEYTIRSPKHPEWRRFHIRVSYLRVYLTGLIVIGLLVVALAEYIHYALPDQIVKSAEHVLWTILSGAAGYFIGRRKP